MDGQAKLDAAYALKKKRQKRERGDRGWHENYEYLQTHGPEFRLTWKPWLWHDKDSGIDGRWPQPMDWSWLMRGMNILNDHWWLQKGGPGGRGGPAAGKQQPALEHQQPREEELVQVV